MRPEVLQHLENARTCAEKIVDFTRDLTLDEFLALSSIQLDGVYMNFAVIGESLNNAVRLDPAVEEDISEIWRIIGFRNQIVHGYFVLKHTITFRTIQSKLPVLIEELSVLLRE